MLTKKEATNSLCGVITSAEPLKRSLRLEIDAWKMLYGKHLNIKYKSIMDDINEFQDDIYKRLSRPIKDLEDVRQAMAALEATRQRQIEIDMSLGPIEVHFMSYNIIHF